MIHHPIRILIVSVLFTGLVTFFTGLVFGFVLGTKAGYRQGYEDQRIFTEEEMREMQRSVK